MLLRRRAPPAALALLRHSYSPSQPHTASMGGRVRFAEEGGEGSAAPDPAPAPASATEVAVRMGILSCGGIYTTPILSDLPGASPPVVRGLEVGGAGGKAAARQAGAPGAHGCKPHSCRPALPEPEAVPRQIPGLSGTLPTLAPLQVSNLSTECRRQPGGTTSVLLLRFWADRPGPFDTTFTICLPDAHQEVGRQEGRSMHGAPAQHVAGPACRRGGC